MLAMSYRGPYRIRIVEKPIPEIEHPRDAIVRVTRACICGSDLHLYHGLVPDTRVGQTFGHETVGVVEEVWASVQTLKPGDRVLMPFNIFCGECYFCQKGLFGNCHNSNPNATAVGGIYGYSHTAGGYDGGQAEYIRVPYADVGPYKIPDTIDDDNAAMCTDAYATGYQAAEMAGIKRGDTVLVFGAGPVGLFAAKCAWFMGAEAHGSTLQYLTGVRMKLQGGAATALYWAIDSVRKGGVVSVVGVYGPTMNAVPIGNAVNKGLTLRMNQASVRRNLPRMIEHIEAGHINPKDVITHRIPLEDIADGYHMFSSKLDACIKPMVIPPRATATA